MEEIKWEKCWKINCSPPLEVYKDHINYFGSNIDIKDLDNLVEQKQRHLDFVKAAKEKWQKEFGNH